MKLSSYLPVVIAMIFAAAASIGGAMLAVGRIEAGARAEVALELVRGGHDWVAVDANGLQVVLTGTAPDEAARFNALTLAGRIVDAARVIDRMDVVQSSGLEPPRFSIEILRNTDGVSIIGLVPRSTDRDELVGRISTAAGGAPIADLLEVADFPAPENWAEVLDYAIVAIRMLGRSKLSVASDAVSVSAIANSVDEQRKLEADLFERAPDGVELMLDVMAPRPVITPFTVRFVIDERGARFDACSADTEAAQERIVQAAIAAGFEGKAPCRIGLGTPSVQWGTAVAAGIEALARVGAGRITYSDADVTLVAAASVSVPEFDGAVGDLRASLPAGFSLHAVMEESVAETDQTVAADEGALVFTATRSPEGLVNLRGRLADDLSLGVVEGFAQSRFGVANTRASVRTNTEVPSGWGLRVLAGIEALALLENGSVTIRPDMVAISGATGNANASAEIAGLLSERLGGGSDFSVNVTYDKALDPIAGLPTPEECVARINAVIAVRKITFAPGAAEIDADALQTVDAIADILKGCRDVAMKIEIGGHTDSQGRESMNLRLSQSRADEVLNAIMARRVLTGNITARGYGETEPIADNGTEEGREANRRIEFRLVTDDETAEQDAAEADDPDAPAEEESTDGQN